MKTKGYRALINLGYEQRQRNAFDYIVVTSEKEIYTTNMQPQNFLLEIWRQSPILM